MWPFGVAMIVVVAAAAAAGTAGSKVRSADGIPIRFDVTGKGEPTVVLVHGWALDRHVWDGQAPQLAKRQRVVTLDLAGHGESGRERSDWTMAAFGQDVKAVVDAVGAKGVLLVGHSMGGPVVLEAARRMPDRVKGIVLVDTLLNVEERTPANEVEAFAGRLQANYEKTATEMANAYLFAPATPEPVRQRVLAQALALPARVSVAILRQVWAYDPLPALREIKAKVRAVNADKFPTNVEVNRRHMPGYEVILVPGSGHYPMLEDPARFGPALDRALREVLTPGR